MQKLENKLVQKRLEPELKLINMETVEVEQIEWLLYPFIPFGKVTIIQGDPGEGKTTMVLQIIAKLTRGESILPDDPTKDKRTDDDNEDGVVDKENIRNNASSYHLETPVNVIYQTAEDGLGDTIKPRLLAAGADCTKVMVIDDSEQPLTMADVRLEEAIVQTKAKMVVLDPIQGLSGGRGGYAPSKRNPSIDEAHCSPGREIPLCDYPNWTHEQEQQRKIFLPGTWFY